MNVVELDRSIGLPQPTPNIDIVKADVARAGYGILTDALSPAEIRAVRKALADEFEREEAIHFNRVRRAEVPDLDPDDRNRRLSRMPDRHPVFLRILELPAVLTLTRHILGPTMMDDSYLLNNYDANETRPGGAAMSIHRDRTAICTYSEPLLAQFILCLDPFDTENGATRVVPGSHLWEDLDRSGATHYESVPAEAPAGSLIVYTDLLLHGTGANTSADRKRAAFLFGYCAPWCRPMVNWPLVLDPKAIKGSSLTLRQLLGYSDTVIGFREPWSSASEELQAMCVPPTMQW